MKMKKDKFASINTTKKHGITVVIIIAAAALCLAGFLYARKLQADSSAVFMDTGGVELMTESEG